MRKTARILSFILSIVLVLSSFPVISSAESVTDENGDYRYEVLPDGTAEIVEYISYNFVTEVTVPDTLDGLTVTSLRGESGDSSVFHSCESLAKVTLPDSITNIGRYAFYENESLESVNIPDSVVNVGENAFSGCVSLPNVQIGKGVKTIGSYAFSGCSLPTSLTIPDNVTDIGSGAFSSCTGLVSATLGEGVVKLGGSCFKDCSSLSSVSLGGNIEEIGSEAFLGTRIYDNEENREDGVLYIGNYLIKANSENVPAEYTVKDGVRVIADGAFSDSYVKKISLPESLISIGRSAFSGCVNLESAPIPKNVKSIGSYAFSGCETLAGDIVIPDGATYLGDNAFANCKKITGAQIGKSVESIGNGVFSGCLALKTINIPESVVTIGSGILSETPVYNDASNWSDGALYIDNCVLGSYTSKLPENLIIKDGARIIANNAFSSREGIAEVTFPESLIRIGASSFEACTELKSVTIPNSVKYIGGSAFSGCASLSDLTLGDGITELSETVFEECPLKNVVMGAGLAEIPGSLTSSSLVSFTIGAGVTKIESSAFYGDYSLESVVIPESVAEIGEKAFYGCSSLTEITLPSGIKAINNDTFYGCDKISDIKIPNGVEQIGERAFYGCSGLTEVVIPEGVTKIGGGAFKNCKLLRSVKIPASVIEIGEEAIGYYDYYDDSYYYTPPTISGVLGSAAENYAKNNNLQFIDINAKPEEPTTEASSVETTSEPAENNSSAPEPSTEPAAETTTESAAEPTENDPSTPGSHIHDYVGVTTREPACVEEGVMTYTCSVCGDSYTETIPANGHTPGDWETVVPPEVGIPGLERQKCAVCGETLDEREIPELPEPTEAPATETTTEPTTKPKPATEPTSETAPEPTIWPTEDDSNYFEPTDEETTAREHTTLKPATQPTTDEGTTEKPATEPAGDNTTEPAASEPKRDLGDVDGDGYATASDARITLRISANLEDGSNFNALAADIDGDGSIAAYDARVILRVSAMLEKRENFAPARESLDGDINRSDDVKIELSANGAKVGETVTVKASIEGGVHLKAGNIIFRYDPSALAFESCETAGQVVGLLDGDLIEDGKVSVGFAYNEELMANSADLLYLTFDVLKEGDSKVSYEIITWEGTDAPNDGDTTVTAMAETTNPPATNPPATRPSDNNGDKAVLSMTASGSAIVGNTVDIIISGTGLRNLISGDLELEFDSEILSPAGSPMPGDIGALVFGGAVSDNDMTVSFAFGSACETDSGKIARVTFNVLKPGSCKITLKVNSWDYENSWSPSAPPDSFSYTLSAAAASDSNIPYDVNGDGKLAAADARLVLRCSAKLETLSESQIKKADANNDGFITASDARGILRLSAKLPMEEESTAKPEPTTQKQDPAAAKPGSNGKIEAGYEEVKMSKGGSACIPIYITPPKGDLAVTLDSSVFRASWSDEWYANSPDGRDVIFLFVSALKSVNGSYKIHIYYKNDPSTSCDITVKTSTSRVDKHDGIILGFPDFGAYAGVAPTKCFSSVDPFQISFFYDMDDLKNSVGNSGEGLENVLNNFLNYIKKYGFYPYDTYHEENDDAIVFYDNEDYILIFGIVTSDSGRQLGIMVSCGVIV